jgi:hypothetical protein
MLKANLMLTGVVLLLGGIALAIFGYNVEPTVGEAIDNVFSGDFTDKRNLMMLGGMIAAVIGGAFMASAALSGGKMRTA